MGCVGTLAACGPSLSDRPSDFHGDGQVEVALICGDTAVGPTQSGSAWLKAVVRAPSDLQVDWTGITLVTHGTKVVRRAAGRNVDVGDRQTQRTVTYWTVSTVEAGAKGAALGPIQVNYQLPGGVARTFEYGHCPLTVTQ